MLFIKSLLAIKSAALVRKLQIKCPFHPRSMHYQTRADGFNYDDPAQWAVDFPQCAGERQSPIALSEDTALRINIPPLKFKNYFTVSVGIPATSTGTKASIYGGGLQSVYEVEGFHFHWGSPIEPPGTEHTINDVRLDMELHIVHKNVKYPTLSEAFENDDGLVVLGLLFEGANRAIQSGLNAVYDALPNLMEYRSRQALSTPITMQSISGSLRTKGFFKYQGSLTTPNCSESVTWFVFMEPFKIEYEYLERFWEIKDSRGQPLVDNYRPIQETNDRKVYFSKARWI